MFIGAVFLKVSSLPAPKASPCTLCRIAFLGSWLHFWVFYPAGWLKVTLLLAVCTLVYGPQVSHGFGGLVFLVELLMLDSHELQQLFDGLGLAHDHPPLVPIYNCVVGSPISLLHHSHELFNHVGLCQVFYECGELPLDAQRPCVK